MLNPCGPTSSSGMGVGNIFAIARLFSIRWNEGRIILAIPHQWEVSWFRNLKTGDDIWVGNRSWRIGKVKLLGIHRNGLVWVLQQMGWLQPDQRGQSGSSAAIVSSVSPSFDRKGAYCRLRLLTFRLTGSDTPVAPSVLVAFASRMKSTVRSRLPSPTAEYSVGPNLPGADLLI